MIILSLAMPGVGIILFGYMVQGVKELGIIGQLPWGMVGAMMLILCIGLIRWRGKVSTAWYALDFPTPGQKVGVSLQGASMMFERLFPSIAGFLNAGGNTGRYYKDDPDGSYGGFGGHDVRLIDREVAYCASPDKALLIESLSKDGFYDWESIEDAVKTKMVNLKQNGAYLLTGNQEPPNILDIDIRHNQAHKELFEYLTNEYFIKVHGRTYSLKNYHRFQEKQAAPIQVGIIIYYAKALAAMRAAKIKTGIGSGIWKLVGIAVLIIVIIVVLLLFATGTISMPAGMIPGSK